MHAANHLLPRRGFLPIVLAIALGFAAACGSPAQKYGASAQPSPQPTATATAVVAFAPPLSTCKILLNAGATSAAIYETYGAPVACVNLAPIVLEVQGNATHGPGFLVCRPSPATQCGDKSAESATSYILNYVLYPFPAAGAQEYGRPVFTQQYECVESGTATWTFHFDTGAYAPGCPALPKTLDQPCDALLYGDTSDTVGLLVVDHGAMVSCNQQGSRLLVPVNGNPSPGVLVCDGGTGAATAAAVMKDQCALGSGPDRRARWQFIPLPVASGPVTGATFDTAAGTACLSAAGQSFTFTVATRAVTRGCAGAPAATATP